MKHVYSKLAITLFSFVALSSYAQADNHQSVTVKGKIINSATDGGESVQTISGKKVLLSMAQLLLTTAKRHISLVVIHLQIKLMLL